MFVVERVFTPALETSAMIEAHARLEPCITERDIAYLGSYFASDRTRSICMYDGADAERLREAHHTAGVAFARLWPAHPVPAVRSERMPLFVTERVLSPPMTEVQLAAGRAAMAKCLAERDVTHRASHLAIDGSRSICVYEAADAERVREANHTAGAPFERVWQAISLR